MTDDFWRQACRKHGLTLHYYIGLLCGQYVYVMQKSAAEDQNKMHTLRSSEEHPQSCQSTGDQLANEIAALSEMVGEGRAEIAEFRRSVETALEIGWEEIRMLTRQSRPLLPIFSGRRTRGKPQK